MNFIGTVAQLKKAQISYEQYETKIVRDLRVKLVGYTFHPTKIISPYTIPCIGDLCTLQDALVSGACHWVQLTPGEVTRHIADLTARETAGEMVMKKRKERSDKGTAKGLRRKPGANDGVAEEEEDETVGGPSKRRKAAMKSKATGKGKAAKGKENQRATKSRKTQLPLSIEFINDSDMEDEDME